MLLDDNHIEYICNKLKNITDTEYLYISEILDLLYNTGCRGSEAIRTDFWTVTNNRFIELIPQKKNYLRLIDKALLKQSTLNYLNINPYISNITSYKRLNYFINKHTSHLRLTIFNKPIVSHIFRHNYVRKMIANNYEIEAIQQLLGHNDIRTTMRYLDAPIESYLNPYEYF